MKKTFMRKKIIYIVLPVLALVFIAGVPINEDRTLLEELIAAFPSGKVDATQQEESRKSLDEVWDDVQKISANNGEDTVSLSGKIRLSDNLDEAGIKEEQRFMIKQAGSNQWFHLDSFDRVQYDQTLFLINHFEKEIIVQPSGITDSLMSAIQMMDPKKFREMLIQNGTTADISVNGSEKTLTISPGTMDMVNRYEIVYDTGSYQIRILRIYYTSIPYQQYLENDNRLPETRKTIEVSTNEQTDEATDPNEVEVEANITEYMLEFEIDKKEKKCDMNFLDNHFYTIKNGEDIVFAGKLAKYKKVRVGN